MFLPKTTLPVLWTSRDVFVAQFYSPYSPQVMSQEGSSQSHPYHQEEANKDQAWLHS